MLFLVVDTAGTAGGVLLAEVETGEASSAGLDVLGFRELPAREFSAQLIAAVAELLGGSPYRLADVEALGVVTGPGSFTGLRVGVSAVKALAEGAAKPIIAVSRLAVMASLMAEPGLVHAVLDAGRGEFYHGIYRNSGWTCMEESLRSEESLTVCLACTPGLLIASEPVVMAALQAFRPQAIPPTGAREALPLIARSWRAGRVSDVLTLDVNYLRASDAEILGRLALHAQQRS